MSQTADFMELREEDIVKHYPGALALLDGFDHSPRIAKPGDKATAPERSSGIGSRRAFRSTTPGLVTRRTQRAEGVRLLEAIEASEGGAGLTSPVQASVQTGLRRALAIALAVGEAFSERTGLVDLKRSNLEGALPADKKLPSPSCFLPKPLPSFTLSPTRPPIFWQATRRKSRWNWATSKRC